MSLREGTEFSKNTNMSPGFPPVRQLKLMKGANGLKIDEAILRGKDIVEFLNAI